MSDSTTCVHSLTPLRPAACLSGAPSLDLAGLRDAAMRNMPPGADGMLLCVPRRQFGCPSCKANADARMDVGASPSPAVVIVGVEEPNEHGQLSRRGFAAVAHSALVLVGLAATCGWFHCLLNSASNTSSSPCVHLCPVCLRKLSLACRPVDFVKRYRALARCLAARMVDSHPAVAWVRERVAVITGDFSGLENDHDHDHTAAAAAAPVAAPPVSSFASARVSARPQGRDRHRRKAPHGVDRPVVAKAAQPWAAPAGGKGAGKGAGAAARGERAEPGSAGVCTDAPVRVDRSKLTLLKRKLSRRQMR